MAMLQTFKVINEKRNVGTWLNTQDFINLIKVCKGRNQEYYDKLIDDLEYLTGEKFENKFIEKYKSKRKNDETK